MSQTNTIDHLANLKPADLVWDKMDGRVCRFVRKSGSWFVLADLASGRELPDERHAIHIEPPHWRK